ncbi:SnoaL-like domain-containing protein [Streptoalloteichus tenebrarius]|uniref:SnoaL-like domain-containing protein n=1 Tax=Streptoalloteichus tenebrarius (strain ATCC 17920 / DSM 40477 / JCM 4838 / CBS 697.72 / NBRC 16177 / NCIMB 11028 / NRRL B-12390 / A12253. 1 / ISP 5477) TaxID=1933 RepID=A0ABT1HXM4_STRSD|nr:nuclear transport factor 2 family protein [Streptoalloteichus tenebrarius]MCP2260264.1 SnoaL-like domain-containing protein [Streptoalloteichus tenebrarius]BFF03014.1 hypothetical protein GCM10020241_46890 [Streptoalloteichus tenebrarius]
MTSASTAASGETVPAETVPPETVSAEVYQELLRFYSRQMQLMDDGAADDWAATFTEDGVFEQNVVPEPWRGRREIATRMRAAAARVAASQLTRRHWIGMVSAQPRGGHGADEVATRYYAVVFDTPRGGTATVHLSTLAEDVLVRAHGSWLVAHRRVLHDGTAWPPRFEPAADPR